MAIQREFILRYRDDGHLRFQIPAQFCEKVQANALSSALLAVEGVYRVQIYSSQRKLSIRYQETVCDFKTLVRQLFQIIAGLEEKKHHEEKALAVSKLKRLHFKDKFKRSKIGQWFNNKVTDTQETVQAAKILTRIGLKKNKALINDPEKAVIDFLNDVLVLFLIRLHWDHITKEWIPHPFKYRNEWAAVFYMLFLLMRSRKPKK